MNNAYHISHNVQVQYMTLGQHKLIESIQDFIWFRGFRYRTREDEDKKEAVFKQFLATLAPR